MDYLTIAISKGSVAREVFKMLKKVGLGNQIDESSRKLLFTDEEKKIRYIYVKSIDVVNYVESGVADLGIVGKDMILEKPSDICELYDLGLGKCKFALAGLKDQRFPETKVLKVATKYIEVTRRYFQEKNQEVELVKLNGSVELAPLVGLADLIVDIVETGNTLKANGLEVIEEIFDISSRLICNQSSYKLKSEAIKKFIEIIKGSEEK